MEMLLPQYSRVKLFERCISSYYTCCVVPKKKLVEYGVLILAINSTKFWMGTRWWLSDELPKMFQEY